MRRALAQLALILSLAFAFSFAADDDSGATLADGLAGEREWDKEDVPALIAGVLG